MTRKQVDPLAAAVRSVEAAMESASSSTGTTVRQTMDLVDRTGRKRSPATYSYFRHGVAPNNKGKMYPPQVLTQDEIFRLITAAPRTPAWQRYPALISTGYRSGARISELLGLWPHHLERQHNRIVIERGKGGRSRYAQMDDWGFDMVDRWMEIRRDYPTGPIFCIVEGATKGGSWSTSGVRQGLVKLRVWAGVEKRVHPHALRHTLACELMRDGYPLSYIQHALGHRNPATTAAYLVSIGAIEGLDAVAARPAPSFAAALASSTAGGGSWATSSSTAGSHNFHSPHNAVHGGSS